MVGTRQLVAGSEVAQRIRAHGRRWDLARSLLAWYDTAVEPVTADDGEWAPLQWTAGEGLSLADRLCLALGHRLDAAIWTVDHSWGANTRIHQIG